MSVSPTQDDTFDVLAAFLANILPDGIPIVQGQGNRVPQPVEDDFIIMIPLRRERIETNIDSFVDKAFRGTIDGVILTISSVIIGTLSEGDQPTGTGVAVGTTVGTQITGNPGGIGTYNVTPSQELSVLTILQAGSGDYMQPTKLTLQVNAHGPNSADNAQIISTLTRDEYAVQFFSDWFSNLGKDSTVIPLYADDPKQLPYNDGEQQVEDRWMIELLLQVNTTVKRPQQFADRIELTVLNIDATYPPEET